MIRWLLFLGLLWPSLLWADPTPIEQLNQIRAQAGLVPFRRNPLLDRAALAHAGYVAYNREPRHEETPGAQDFTGVTPYDRGKRAGFTGVSLAENLSQGQQDWQQSLSGLMAAIYHRNAFLAPDLDELGIGREGAGERTSFVYLMGRQGPSPSDQPAWVWWPVEGGEVPPAFFEEIPDPLPDLSVSGYPVSIRFNPEQFASPPKLLDFRLSSGGVAVTETRILTAHNDPNGILDKFSFVLFPLKRLEWGQVYKVEAQFDFGSGETKTLSWSFKTELTKNRLVQIAGKGEWLGLEKGEAYSLYLPPDLASPYIGEVHWEGVEGNDAKLVWEDKNTLTVIPKGKTCGRLRFYFGPERGFWVTLMGPGETTPPSPHPPACKPSELKGLPDFKVKGGEIIQLKSGQLASVQLAESLASVSPIRWSFPAGVSVDFKRIGEVHLKIGASGPPGSSVEFKLGDQANFVIQLTR